MKGNSRLTVSCKLILDDLKPGDSVAVSGVCLTATKITSAGFIADATSYTLEGSTLRDLKIGAKVNLERAMQVGARFGGHIVQGHVDGIGRTAKIRYGEGMTDLYIEAPPEIMKLIAPKGSVAVDGVSLTVAEKTANGFHLMLVPFTLENTTLGELVPGARVNIETDLIIRWLADRFPDGEVTSAEGIQTAGWGTIHLEE